MQDNVLYLSKLEPNSAPDYDLQRRLRSVGRGGARLLSRREYELEDEDDRRAGQWEGDDDQQGIADGAPVAVVAGLARGVAVDEIADCGGEGEAPGEGGGEEGVEKSAPGVSETDENRAEAAALVEIGPVEEIGMAVR